MNPLFNVSDFEVCRKKISVGIALRDENLTVEVSRRKYEAWIAETGRLSFEMNFTDGSPGNMKATEYWNLPSSSINEDLYQFIILNPTNELNNHINLLYA